MSQRVVHLFPSVHPKGLLSRTWTSRYRSQDLSLPVSSLFPLTLEVWLKLEVGLGFCLSFSHQILQRMLSLSVLSPEATPSSSAALSGAGQCLATIFSMALTDPVLEFVVLQLRACS